MIITSGKASLPHDPLKIKSMADYDLSLAISRAWMEFDEGRLASPGIIKSWLFENCVYIFKIDERYKWSDGTDLTSNDLLFNIKRIVNKNSSFSQTIKAILKIDKIEVLDKFTLKLPTFDEKNHPDLINRLSSVFSGIVNPNDCDIKGQVIGNKISIGPYQIVLNNQEEIILQKNKFYPLRLERLEKVILKKIATPPIIDFLDGKTGLNLIQISSLMDESSSNKLANSKFSIWSRGHDRVALLKPNIKNTRLSQNKKLLQLAGEKFSKMDIGKLSLNSIKARSLQPLGYPLFREISYNAIDKNTKLSPKIKIITAQNDALGPLRHILTNLFSHFDVQIEWLITNSFSESMMSAESQDADFVLFSFGVADPEPSTWLSLVLGKDMPFVSYTDNDYKKFINILNSKDQMAVDKMRELLAFIGSEGGYLPLVHFSTLSVGIKELDLSGVHELDETVDFSKIKFKK